MRITKINLKLRLLKVEIQWKCEVQTLKLEITTEFAKLYYLRLHYTTTTLICLLHVAPWFSFIHPLSSVGPTGHIPPKIAANG